uniref:Uncharacterized protein n=1 Tax=Tetranychus urticae TaxID=32264 RepID=T1JSH0_TETUR
MMPVNIEAYEETLEKQEKAGIQFYW